MIDRAEILPVTQKQIAGQEVHVVALPYINSLANPRVIGFPLRQLAERSSESMMSTLVASGRVAIDDRVLTVGIPRGGYPYGKGADNFLAKGPKPVEHQLMFSNAGSGSNPDQRKISGLSPNEISQAVLVDGVIGAGNEVIEHIRQILELAPEVRNFLILSAVAASVGLENIVNFCLSQGIQPTIGTGRVYEAEGEYKFIGWKDVGGRKVFMIGVGDNGQRVQGWLTREQLDSIYLPSLLEGMYHPHQLQPKNLQ